MAQKLIIGILMLAIMGVIGFGLLDAARSTDETESTEAPLQIEVDAVVGVPTHTPQPSSEPVAEPTTEPIVQSTTEPVPTVMVNVEPQQPVVSAQNTMGDPWQAEGVITTLDDFGFTLSTTSGEYFVELGPPTYWQTQGITLNQGDPVSVQGFYNGQQVHAQTMNANGAELVIRTESGQPMWAGGADNGGNGNNGENQMAGAQMQVSPEDWVTLRGVISSVTNGNVTLNVDDGTVLNLQMGQPQFWQSQGVALNAGDQVEVLGFWSGSQFMAGDVRKVATGETIMLRDPNGRQMWAGPGRNDAQGGNGQHGGNNEQGNNNQNNQSSNGGNQGNDDRGNQYRGGR